jgi:hypothetical protein
MTEKSYHGANGMLVGKTIAIQWLVEKNLLVGKRLSVGEEMLVGKVQRAATNSWSANISWSGKTFADQAYGDRQGWSAKTIPDRLFEGKSCFPNQYFGRECSTVV